MSKTGRSKLPDPASLTFEQATAELEAIVHRIEQGEIGLEESLVARHRGDALIERCRAILTAAEQEIRQVKGADLPTNTAHDDADDHEDNDQNGDEDD